MRIELTKKYKSIEILTTEELPDFAILIGRNGAGKTQLLDALHEGHAVIPGIAADEIEPYDMVSFRTNNAGGANRLAPTDSPGPLLMTTCCLSPTASRLSRLRQQFSTSSPMTSNANLVSKHATTSAVT